MTEDNKGGKISISSPIERKSTTGRPSAIVTVGADLNKRQKKLLEQLPSFDSRVIVHKKDVNLKDLSALTAQSGVEFALFTKGNGRLIIRGNEYKVDITPGKARQLAAEGWRWSGHTHPGTDIFVLNVSGGDIRVLKTFSQEKSVILNSKGQYLIFDERGRI